MINKRLNGRFVIVLAIPLLAGIAACGKDFLVENPKNIITAENLYTNLAGFDAGLNAIYAQVRREHQGRSGTNELFQEPFILGTDMGYANYVSTTERIFNEWGVRNNATADVYSDLWLWLYQIINASNTIIDRAENPAVAWTDADKNRVLGEARLLRAWAYRHLVYSFGPVPLMLHESTGDNIRYDWQRNPVAEIRGQMESDLLFAEANLPLVPPSDGRIGKGVAEHYLAELYLAMGDPVKADTMASRVINSGVYHLITARYGTKASQPGVPFMDQFEDGNADRSQGNTETLWTFLYAKGIPGGGASIMRRYWANRYYNNKGVAVSEENGGRGIGRMTPTRWSLGIYEPTDDRGSYFAIRKFYLYNDAANLPAGKQLGDTLKTRILARQKINDALWPTTRKWDYTDPTDINGDEGYKDEPYLRLADTYLLLAEAQLKEGRPDLAAETINIVRARSNASAITAADVTIDFILDERAREFMGEEERRETLIRTGTLLPRIRAYNDTASKTIAERDTVFPIPQVVIDANTGSVMEQNPGY
jgi:hypothetical protein